MLIVLFESDVLAKLLCDLTYIFVDGMFQFALYEHKST